MSAEDGNIEMIIAPEDGQVVMRFKEPVEFVVFDPQNMIDIATALTDAAFEARDGLKPVGDTLKAELIERHRMTLTHRFSRMIATMREDKKVSTGKLAQELVDASLKEIF